MIKLLIQDAAPGETSPQTCFGGLPLIPDGVEFSWPKCQACGGSMQFLGHILSDASEQRLVLLFMCQNAPGLCEEWDADAGGNRALVVQGRGWRPATAPEEGETLRPVRYGAVLAEMDAPDYDAARDLWVQQTGQPLRRILGQVLGSPAWLQGDETPCCDCCQKPMKFLAQLEQGPDWETEMNFGGGGIAYAFVCGAGGPAAKFLWQC